LRSTRTNTSGDPISKIIREKWTRGVAQAVEHLVWKHEALSPSPTKRKGGRERRREERGDKGRKEGRTGRGYSGGT
jgi:hypothetical protein